MPAFASYAPGKVILFGEHAVVYGRPAIAAPLASLRARVQVSPAPHFPKGRVHIEAPEVNLQNELDDLAKEHPLRRGVELVQNAIGAKRIPACTVRITSTIPVAAGLGSGAAVSVALMRALSAYLGHPLSDSQVCALAYEVEKIHHGTPSGIDNTVITYARPVYFVRGQPIEMLEIKSPFTIVIGDTGIASLTSAAVGDVRQAWQANPSRFEALFDQIGLVVSQARMHIEQNQSTLLGRLMDENQRLLQEIGVSSPELDHLVDAARTAGALGAKLSGGGRGGNMIALVNTDQVERVTAAIQAAGAVQVFASEIL